MKTNNNDLIITNMADKYSIGIFPRLNRNNTDYDFSHKLAICLSWSAPLHHRVAAIRDKHQITLHKVPLTTSFEDLLAIAGKNTPRTNKLLSDEAVKLCVAFGLPIHWRLSIIFLMLTNTIFIVPNLPKISLYTPLKYDDDQDELSISIHNLMVQDLVRKHPIKDSVAIYFNARTTAKEVAKWLSDHHKEFDDAQRKLPTYKHWGISNAELYTLEWGELAWIIKDCNRIDGWANILDATEYLYEHDEYIAKYLKLPARGLEENEMANRYKAFKKAVISLGEFASK